MMNPYEALNVPIRGRFHCIHCVADAPVFGTHVMRNAMKTAEGQSTDFSFVSWKYADHDTPMGLPCTRSNLDIAAMFTREEPIRATNIVCPVCEQVVTATLDTDYRLRFTPHYHNGVPCLASRVSVTAARFMGAERHYVENSEPVYASDTQPILTVSNG